MYNVPLNFRKPNIPKEFQLSNIQLAKIYKYWMQLMAIAKNKEFAVGKILPTVAAFTQNMKNVYYPVQNWLYSGFENSLNPLD